MSIQPFPLKPLNRLGAEFQVRQKKDRRHQLKRAKTLNPDFLEYGPPRNLKAKQRVDPSLLTPPEQPQQTIAPPATPAAEAATTAAPDAELSTSEADSKSWVPSWLKFLVPGELGLGLRPGTCCQSRSATVFVEFKRLVRKGHLPSSFKDPCE